MTPRQYYIGLSVIVASIFLSPELEQLLRVYVVSAVVFVTGLINVLFRWKQLHDYIVKRIVTSVTEELFSFKSYNEFLKLRERVQERLSIVSAQDEVKQ